MSSAWKGHQVAWTMNVSILLPVCPAAALVFCAGCYPAPDAPLDSGHQALRTEVYAALNKRSNTLPQIEKKYKCENPLWNQTETKQKLQENHTDK